jgi:hypothetical protein
MHTPLAVGKVVSFKPETFYDPTTKSFYSGVYVDAYISKGAQDTWEKVLDGTLSGFSIGGKINESDNEVNKSTGQSVRFIKDYDLIELSIVDSPANELCNILSISKVNGQLVFKGIAADVKMENIFYCAESDSVFISTDKTYVSPVTNKPAELIGWVESNDVNKAKEIDKILDAYKQSRVSLPETQTIAKQANAEGGNEVSENTETVAAVEETPVAVEETPVAEAPAVEAAEAAADAPAETLEKAADVSEVEVDEPDFAKMLGEIKDFFSETVAKSAEQKSAEVSAIKDSVESFSKTVEAKITELAEQNAALSKAVAEINTIINTVEKRVDAVESDTAIKKSSDLGGSQEVLQKSKSKWNGSFLGSVQELIK